MRGSGQFKLLANVLKKIQRKMLVSFLRPENSAVLKSIFFFHRGSRGYMQSQLKNDAFLGYEQVGWIQKCPFLQYQFYPSWFKPSAGRFFFFQVPAGVTSLPSKGGVGWLVVYVNQRKSLLDPVSTKGVIDNNQCSYLIQRFYSHNC